MTELYGSNLGGAHRPRGLKTSFDPRKVGRVTAWWCPTCQTLVEQVADPIECAGCEGDMTIAPASARKGKR